MVLAKGSFRANRVMKRFPIQEWADGAESKRCRLPCCFEVVRLLLAASATSGDCVSFHCAESILC